MNKEFYRLTITRVLFTLVIKIQAVTLGWQVYSLTKNPLMLGFIGLTEALPALILSLISGYIVDRSNPVWIYRGVLAINLVASLLLLCNSFELFGQEVDVQVKFAYLGAFLSGVGRGFSGPAMYSIVPKLISREQLSIGSAWSTSAFQFSSILGPLFAGLICGWAGVSASYGVQLGFMVLALGVFSALKFNYVPLDLSHEQSESIGKKLTSGMRFVFAHNLLLPALALDMFSVMFGGVYALLPIFADQILNVGPKGLGALRAAPSIGSLIVTTMLIKRPVERNAGRILLWVVAGYGVSILGFGISKSFLLSMICLAASGAFDAVSMVIRGAIVQMFSPDHMRGRIAAVNSFFIGSSNELGDFESGIVAHYIGAIPCVLFGGSMTLAVVAFTAWMSPALRRMDLSFAAREASAPRRPS